ncbi:SAM-dependent methyltransferase [Nocardia sp. NPDC049149]|uniref:SAM-dependent methyltransferase n=1 Tax=Nocardia sp. NPDC049149 TaxID=3364315 RepID=UPI00371215B3
MADVSRPPMGVDPYTPNSARAYNYMLGGKDNYEADQLFAERVLEVAPDSRALAHMSRRFLLRGVRLAAMAGVRQFIDIGAGIPISPSVAEVARQVDPSSRVVAIDFDPVVYAHWTATPSEATPMLADLRHPDDLIDRLRTEELIDFTQPVAILIVGVLHFIHDKDHPAQIIARLRDEMAPESYLVFTHASSEGDQSFTSHADAATRGSSSRPSLRPCADVAGFLDGFKVLDPGLTPIQRWLDDGSPTTLVEILGCVCRKP